MSIANKIFLRLVRIHNLFLANNDHDSAVAVREYIERVINYYIEVSTVIDRTFVRYAGLRMNIGSELIDDALIGAHYRIESREQLRRLLLTEIIYPSTDD